MTEADEGTAIANAEAFCRTLEAIARTLPKVALATHPALGAGAVGGAAVAQGDEVDAAGGGVQSGLGKPN